MSIERLSFSSETKYNAAELAIHLTRYSAAQKICSGLDVLDVACGEGYGSFAMASFWKAHSVKGVDISEEAIKTAKNSFSHPNVEYFTAAAEKIGEIFQQHSFDMVVSLETIEHVSDPEIFLSAVKKVLKPTGVLILSCPNDHWYYGPGESKNPFHLRTYYFDEFKDLAEKHFGKAKCYLMGRPITGFGNFLLSDTGNFDPVSTMKDQLLNANEIEINQVQPDEVLSTEDCSFFVGIWGELPVDKEQLVNGAFCATSMDKFSLTLESNNQFLLGNITALTANAESSRKWNDELQTALKFSQNRITDLEKWTNELQTFLNSSQDRILELDKFVVELQESVLQYQAQLDDLNEKLQLTRLESEKFQLESEKFQLESEKFQQDFSNSQAMVKLMEESKFWKIRNHWFNLKEKFNSNNNR